MTELQAAELLTKLDTIILAIDGLEWAAAVVAKVLTLQFGFWFWMEARRTWTSGSGLF